jgi:transposase
MENTKNKEFFREENEFKYFIGVDVAKNKLDLFNTLDQKHQTIENRQEALEQYIAALRGRLSVHENNVLVVIDLTGGYEKLCLNTFYDSNFKNIILAEGLKVRNFKKSLKNNGAKTDRLDCMLLVEYGKCFYHSLPLYKPQDKDRVKVTQLYSRIENLKEIIQREKNRLKQPNILRIVEIGIENQLKFLTEETEVLKREILTIIENNRELKVIYDTLMGQRGIGNELALFFIAKLRELGKIERKQLSSICGLAPVPHDSGKMSGHRYANGGRRDLKSKLYFCAMNLIRFDETFKNKLNDFLERGKSKKLSLVALARKKIVILNAVVRNELGKLNSDSIGDCDGKFTGTRSQFQNKN